VSWAILGGFLINWSSETGLINDLLMKAGLINQPIYLLGDPKYFWGLAVGSGIWKEMGWSAIIYIAAIAGINPELYEVATIDGANRFQRIIHITLPCIKGTIAILFTFTVAGLLNSNFEQIFVLKNTLNASASTVLDIYVYQVGMRLARYSYATAVGLLKSVVALILLIVSNRVSDKLTGASFI
jgi:putative aldouronate transport system permease protein